MSVSLFVSCKRQREWVRGGEGRDRKGMKKNRENESLKNRILKTTDSVATQKLSL